jgi:hypothetical protein
MKRETVKCAKSRREMERDRGDGEMERDRGDGEMERDRGDGEMEEGNEMKRKEERGI